MLKMIENKVNRMRLKNEVLVLKGMIAEMMNDVDWNEDNLTLENKIKLDKLGSLIIEAERRLNKKAN
jgi:hypothetical protein